MSHEALHSTPKFLAVVVGLGLCLGIVRAFAQESDLNGPPAESEITPLVKPKPTNGSVKCTAAINSDGSILSCKHCNPADTARLNQGAYKVGFTKPCKNILALNGWSRWVQADTLETGSEEVFCTTADRIGDANAVFVLCLDASGAPTDASFFLFVAR